MLSFKLYQIIATNKQQAMNWTFADILLFGQTSLRLEWKHYNHVIMSTMASQIISLMIVYLTVYSSRRSKKTSKLHITGLCEGNSPVTTEFPAQRASNAENVSIWWHHHDTELFSIKTYLTMPSTRSVPFCLELSVLILNGIIFKVIILWYDFYHRYQQLLSGNQCDVW